MLFEGVFSKIVASKHFVFVWLRLISKRHPIKFNCKNKRRYLYFVAKNPANNALLLQIIFTHIFSIILNDYLSFTYFLGNFFIDKFEVF